MNIVCLGFGYTARHFANLYKAQHQITGSVRSAEKAAALKAQGYAAFVFDGAVLDQDGARALADADALIVSIPPGDAGDGHAVIARHIMQNSKTPALLYLSTIGVYGDRHGAWVSEDDVAIPTQPRSIWRLAAETNWRRIGAETGAPTAIFRLSGIYGPGQNALVQLRSGLARCIIKPDQVFNRIHVTDIARVLHATILNPRANAIYNVSDDEPAPPQDVMAYAASLLNVACPAPIDWRAANLSPMALSFYEENKRVSNRLIRQDFGADILLYPTYREGLRALL